MIKVSIKNESDLPFEEIGKVLDKFEWASLKEDKMKMEKLKWHDELYMADKEYNIYFRKLDNSYVVRVALCFRVRHSKWED